jgi:hypothetical protein
MIDVQLLIRMVQHNDIYMRDQIIGSLCGVCEQDMQKVWEVVQGFI